MPRKRLEVERTDRDELARDIRRASRAGVEAVLAPHSEALERFKEHAYLLKTWLTLDEAARYASVSRSTLDNWRADGLPVSKVGRQVYVKRDDLDAFIGEHKAG